MEYPPSAVYKQRYQVNLVSRMKSGNEAIANRTITCDGIFELLRELDTRFTFFIGEAAQKVTIIIQK